MTQERSTLWETCIADPIPGRRTKPRETGVTMIIDTGMGIGASRDLADLASPYIDFVKLGFGSSKVYPDTVLQEKIVLWHQYGIPVYPGGTFLEIAVLQGRWESFLERCREIGFAAVEISDGTIELGRSLRTRMIRKVRDMGFVTLTEVGKKSASQKLTVSQQVRNILEDLAAGASYVIIEGRESGRNTGLFDENGALSESELLELLNGLESSCIEKMIWESPLPSQQENFIRLFGPNVNLGNIPPSSVVSLESLRRGLRSDTLRSSPLMTGAAIPGLKRFAVI
jgi:phosphosulfolactate synthase